MQEKVADIGQIRSDITSKYLDADASPLEDALNNLNNRILNANQRISDRQAKLEEALIQCGQFKDASKSLLAWLEETQELVDGQRSIAAADPNVLKAQIMEQKVRLVSPFPRGYRLRAMEHAS